MKLAKSVIAVLPSHISYSEDAPHTLVSGKTTICQGFGCMLDASDDFGHVD